MREESRAEGMEKWREECGWENMFSDEVMEESGLREVG